MTLRPAVATMLRPLRAVRLRADTVRYVSALLGEPVTVEEAVRHTQERLTRRAESFLDVLQRVVFAHPDSAYRLLLASAGYDLARLRILVQARGVEETLHQLQRDGIYVTIEEFKGLQETRRGDRVFRFTEENFRNPLIRSGLRAPSGGTRGPVLWNVISLSNHRMGAEHLALALEAYGLRSAPVALWMAAAHGASGWAVLALAAMGRTPPRWFTHLPLKSLRMRASVFPLYAGAWRRGIVLPRTTYVPLGEEGPVLDWIRRQGGEGCAFLTSPSLALRVALAAQQARVDLAETTFITIAEPLTPAKLSRIRAAGARAFSSLGFTEFGRVTYGCPAGEVDETHICRDAVAVIQHRRTVDRLGTSVDALLFTTLQADARRILLNTETGDYARLLPAGCGCFLERLGWGERLRDIRSFEKLNAEGRLFYGTQLIDLVEQVLPGRFGGDPTDYQLVEQEDAQGFTRLSIFVHPRLRGVAEEAIRRAVEEALRGYNTGGAAVWEEAGTVRLVRAAPILTAAGKLMPLHHLS